MARRYLCPHCRATLNPGTKIVLRLRHGRKHGLVLLSPQVGNYKTIIAEEILPTTGQVVHLYCPVCGVDLRSASSHKLAELLLDKETGDLERIAFSRTYGEHATFVVRDNVIRVFGDDAVYYDSVNFFGEGREKHA